ETERRPRGVASYFTGESGNDPKAKKARFPPRVCQVRFVAFVGGHGRPWEIRSWIIDKTGLQIGRTVELVFPAFNRAPEKRGHIVRQPKQAEAERRRRVPRVGARRLLLRI